MDGSASVRLDTRPTDASPLLEKKRAKEEEFEEEEDEELDEAAQGQPQGRRLAQSGQRLLSLSLRQVEQTPLLRRLVGCKGHFHTSSSSTYIIVMSVEESFSGGFLSEISSLGYGCI